MKRKEFGNMHSFNSFPSQGSIYITSKCNFNCSFCQKAVPGMCQAKDADIPLVDLFLRKYPSIKGICLAGFGEPFLSSKLPEIIQFLHQKNKYVGLITNGSLLTSGLNTLTSLPKALPEYISISLNASNAVLHEKVTGTRTWDKVIDGIKQSVSKVPTHLSYVCTKENIHDIKNFMVLAKQLKVQKVFLRNLLPHYKECNDDFWNLVLQEEDRHLVDAIKKLPNASIIETYPVLIKKNEVSRRCDFPWKHIMVDGDGNISVCCVFPCSANQGNIKDSVTWTNDYCTKFRESMLGKQNSACRRCFRNW